MSTTLEEDVAGIAPAVADNAPPAMAGEPGGAGEPDAVPPPQDGEEGREPVKAPDNPDAEWLRGKGWLADDGSVKADAVVQAYRELEKKIGAQIKVPDETTPAEERDAFMQKLGWPGSAEGYEFKLPENMPKDMPYDEALAAEFKAWANEVRLPAATAQALHDKWIAKYAADAQAFYQERAEAARKAHAEIVREWGAPGSQEYARNVDAATRALRNDPKLAGLEQEFIRSGILTPDGKFTSPAIAHLLASHGRSLQNDGFVGTRGAGPAAGNPFDPKDKAHNLSEQARLIRESPDVARQLAIAAGWSPEAIDAIGRP